MTPVVSVEAVSYAYPEARSGALRDVSLQIESGEFVALVGQNGAGKTTLAKHFNGLLVPTSGTVRIIGLDTRNESMRRLAAIVGYCYQNPDHQIFNRTLRREVSFGPRNLGLPPDQIARNVEEALRLVGLWERADDYPFLLGRGERQRLAVASILAMGSQILVIDEPTTGLDLHGVRGIMDLLATWNRDLGRTIVIITHDIGIVAEYVPRTVMMAGGAVVADGPTSTVLTDRAALEAAAVRPPQVTRMAQQLAAYGISPQVMTVAQMVEQVRSCLAAAPRGRSD